MAAHMISYALITHCGAQVRCPDMWAIIKISEHFGLIRKGEEAWPGRRHVWKLLIPVIAS